LLTLPTESAADGTIDELLPLARVSPEAAAARLWLGDALTAVWDTVEWQLAATGARHLSNAPPASAPLKRVERAALRLIAALEQLRLHPNAHTRFWRFAAFGPVYANQFARPGVISTLTNVRDAARNTRVRRTGRPRNFRKQKIVDLALAFCARFSPESPSSDVNNFFPRFARRFFEKATGLSAEDKGCGIDRQIRVAMRRLPIERERAKLLSAQISG
jgi:hypothetical protein